VRPSDPSYVTYGLDWGIDDAWDSGSGVRGVQALVEGAPVGVEDTTEPYGGAEDIVDYGDGAQFAASFQVCDRVGNCAETEPRQLLRDTTPPTVKVTNPKESAGAPAAEVRAFPSAEGFGRYATGGRGGSVCRVTSLANSGAGTLRECLTTNPTSPRTIVFTMGGTITLTSDIDAAISNVTVACQTAPGDGVMVKGTIRARPGVNQIWRYCRIRQYTAVPTQTNVMSLGQGSVDGSVIADHMSMGYAFDDTFAISNLSGGKKIQGTIQWSLVYHVLKDLSVGSGGAVNGYPDNQGGGANLYMSVLHNLFVATVKRVPIQGGGNVQIVNNVSHLCETNECTYVYASGSPLVAEVVNNHYNRGANTIATLGCGWGGYTCHPDYEASSFTYIKGNVHTSLRPDAAVGSETAMVVSFGNPYPWQSTTRPAGFPVIASQTSALQAKTDAIAKGGATVPKRDSIDAAAVSDVVNNTGKVCGSGQPPSLTNAACLVFPAYAAGTAPTDTDADGMPDSWEVSQGAANGTSLVQSATAANGYTNLENYLNTLAGDTIPGASGGGPATIGGSVTFTATVADAESGVSHVDYYAGTNYLGTTYDPPYSLAVNTAYTPSGTYNVTAVATNNAGLEGTSPPVSVVFDNGAPTGQLLTHLKFNDGAGTTAADSSSAGNSATFVGTPAWIPGVEGGALQTSSGNYASLGNKTAWNLASTDHTIFVRFKVLDPSVGSYLFGRATTSAFKGFSATINTTSGGQVNFIEGQGASGGLNITTASNLRDGNWHTLFLRNTKASKTVDIFSECATTTPVGTGTWPGTLVDEPTKALLVGWNEGASATLPAAFDEFRVYSKALTKTEMDAICTTIPDTTPPISPTSLTATKDATTPTTKINLAWTASLDTAGYRVQSCPGSGACSTCSPWTKLGDTAALTYADTGLLPGTSRCYRIRSYDGTLATPLNFSETFSNLASAVTDTVSSGGTVDASVTLEAYPPVSTSGQNVTLTWNSDYATSCTASGGTFTGSKSPDGSATVTPTATTTYTVSCQGDTGVAWSDQVQVVVQTGTVYHVRCDGVDTNPGTANSAAGAWRNIAKANSKLAPGDTVFIHGGCTYTDGITPATSGTTDLYKSYLGWPGDTVQVRASSGATSNLTDKDWIIIGGVTLLEPGEGNSTMVMNGSDRDIVWGSQLLNTSASKVNMGNALDITNSSFNKFLSNRLESQQAGTVTCPTSGDAKPCPGYFEVVRMKVGSHHNLFGGNFLGRAKHGAFNATAVSPQVHDNVIRGNTLQNTWHSSFILYPSAFDQIEGNAVMDAGGEQGKNPWASERAPRLDASGYQLGGDTKSSAGILAEGGIIRRNIFDNNGKINDTRGSKNYRNYHNVYYRSYQVLTFTATDLPPAGMIYKNNVYDQQGRAYICITGNVEPDANTYDTNNIRDQLGFGGNTGGTCTDVRTLATLQSSYPTKWKGNLNVASGFVDDTTGARDFHLTSGSALLNAGAFLTTTTNAGTSATSMNVADASYFSAGKGIVKGDIIMTAGKKVARITAISGNTLTLSRAITWTNGEGLSLLYYGAKPDIGAFERVQ